MEIVKAKFKVRVWQKNRRIGGWVVNVKATPCNLRRRALARVRATLPPGKYSMYAELVK